MNRNRNSYFIEEDRGLYYVYDNETDDLVYIASSKESLNDFYPGLGSMNESFMEVPKKPAPVSKKTWDHDKHLEEVCKFYRNWAGFEDDQTLTEDLLRNEDWRLKRVSALKNVPVKKIREMLLKDSK